MYRIYLTILLLGYVTLGTGSEILQDYRIKYQNISVFADGCNREGRQCRNCRDIIDCALDANNVLQATLIQQCNNGQICENNRCIPPPARPSCSPIDHLSFTCSNKPGIYPDPANCRRYYICANPEVNPGQLTAHMYDCRSEGNGLGFSYNPKSTFCDKALSNEQCSGYPVPLCSDRISAALPSNPTIFYECRLPPGAETVLYPYLSRCDNGKRYSPVYHCR